jgi:hypothetical protein
MNGGSLPYAWTATVWHLAVRSGLPTGAWQKGSPVLTQGFRLEGVCSPPMLASSIEVPFIPAGSLVPLSPDQALIGGHDLSGAAAIALVGSDQALTQLDPPAWFPTDAAFAESGSGTEWFLSGHGAISDLPVGREFNTPLAAFPVGTGTTCAALDGDPLGAFELFGVVGADIGRFRAPAAGLILGAWVVIHRHRGAANARVCGVVWVSPGEVFALSEDPASLIHVVGTTTDADSMEQVLPPGTSGEGLSSIVKTQSFGLLAGTDRGGVYQRESTRGWARLATAPFPIDWITETPQGLLLSDRTGSVLLLSTSGASCPVVDTGGTIDARPLLQAAGVLVAGRSRGPDNVRGRVRWLLQQ